MSDVYELRLYDEVLIIFNLFEKGLEGLVSEILYVNEEKKHLSLSMKNLNSQVLNKVDGGRKA